MSSKSTKRAVPPPTKTMDGKHTVKKHGVNKTPTNREKRKAKRKAKRKLDRDLRDLRPLRPRAPCRRRHECGGHRLMVLPVYGLDVDSAI